VARSTGFGRSVVSKEGLDDRVFGFAATPYSRFENLSYADFRQLAGDPSLSRYEKIGFPDSYRAGKEEAIFADIECKLPSLRRPGRVVLDIGPGCSGLPHMLIGLCERQEHRLVLADSAEMLDHLPDKPFIEKHACYFPDCAGLFERYSGRVDTILAYSILHYVFDEGNIFRFLDKAMQLLASGGEMLIGDVPNVSKRKRFFVTAAGAQYHRQFTGRDEDPPLEFLRVEDGKIDDAVLVGLMLRARAAGCDAYLLPQADDLPLANRREDLLVRKP
jgi:hypothetical protein